MLAALNHRSLIVNSLNSKLNPIEYGSTHTPERMGRQKENNKNQLHYFNLKAGLKTKDRESSNVTTHHDDGQCPVC